MYADYYHIRELPFRLTPDTAFFFPWSGALQAWTMLNIALDAGEGFLMVTGEPGMGKTLLCRKLLNELGKNYLTAYIPNPLLAPMDLYQALAGELSLPLEKGEGFQNLIERITKRLIELRHEGQQVVVIIDEAQSLPTESLEALRLMTNLETEKEKILQVVLLGQTELVRRLKGPGLSQMLQRITFSHVLNPMRVGDVERYVEHRMRVAGHQGAPLFHPRAVRSIARASKGVPRLVNILCHKAMMTAFGRGDSVVAPRHVRSAVKDSSGIGRWFPVPSLPVVAAGGVASMFGAGIAVLSWSLLH
ncbi:MAG: AAA family ATPase [Magnetococcales bacterium]|nr:AAA family ATPase [Magnetococcales bacterium]